MSTSEEKTQAWNRKLCSNPFLLRKQEQYKRTMTAFINMQIALYDYDMIGLISLRLQIVLSPLLPGVFD